jgi:hypothetical protein
MYLKPPTLTRKVINPLARRFQRGGVAELTVTKRHSGTPQHVPVIPVQVSTTRYLVCPYGDSDWVRNLRAAGRATLREHGRTHAFSTHEVPSAERPPIIAAYLESVHNGDVRRCFDVMPDPTDHPVFSLDGPAGTAPAPTR